jgi:hypothetical protein
LTLRNQPPFESIIILIVLNKHTINRYGVSANIYFKCTARQVTTSFQSSFLLLKMKVNVF